MKLIQGIGRDRAHIVAQDIKRGENLFLIKDGERVLLPVYAGMQFGLEVTNLTDAMLAIPTFVESGDLRRNIYWENAETNPDLCPSTGGMWETYPYGTHRIEGFSFPQSRTRPFVVTQEGMGLDGVNASAIVVYARTAANPGILPPVTTTSQFDPLFGVQCRSGSRGGPIIGATEMRPDGRIITNLDYNQDAGEPVVRITLIDRRDALVMLEQIGVSLESVTWSF